jgi:tRNA A37 threonylcarbamoyladenosine dehydratase
METRDNRFTGIVRLYGAAGLARLRRAQVCVVGIGGVGSWAAEALARSGVGALSLVDLDEVCLTNLNRQIHALDRTVGRPKVDVMAERIQAINPKCQVTRVQEFFTELNGERLLDELVGRATAAAGGTPPQPWIVDAIDSVADKTLLIAWCRRKGLPLVVCGAAGGRREATKVELADLADASHDRLLTAVRRRLREEHGFPTAGHRMEVACVYSPETPMRPPSDCSGNPLGAADVPQRLNCDWGYGSATFVTGTVGFAAAGCVVNRIAAGS